MKACPVSRCFLIVLLWHGIMIPLLADPVSILETRISLRVQNERLADVLLKVSSQGGFSFSYSPDASIYEPVTLASAVTDRYGYFSYVRKNGYCRIELATDELQYGNVTFKTGVRKFYNIFTLGTSAFLPNKPFGSIGYGVGTARYLGRRSRGDARKWMLNLDFVASRVALERRFLKSPYAVHTRLAISLERKIGPRLALTVGPSLNLFFSPYKGLVAQQSDFANPFQTTFRSTGDGNLYGWVGFQAGLRFCNRLR